jgi:hypothetical protein
MNGSGNGATGQLALRACIGLALVLGGAIAAYLLSYLRTIRRIVEAPDILPASNRLRASPKCGDSLQTAVLHFSARTLLRSRQHRVMLAFYLGLGFAILTVFMRTPRARSVLHEANVPLIFSSLVMMCVAVVGTRVAFAVPLDLRANWVFQMAMAGSSGSCLAAARRPLFIIAVIPVWIVSAAFFLSTWPWQAALGHLVVLCLWGIIVAWISLAGFHKIPFTCSWLPGKSFLHMSFLAALGLLFLVLRGAVLELRALADPGRYMTLVCALGMIAVVMRWITISRSKSEDAIVQFEEVPDPAVLGLGLQRDGILPDFHNAR